MGKAFLLEHTNFDDSQICIMPLPEFKDYIEFYSDPKKFNQKHKASKKSYEDKLEAYKKMKLKSDYAR